MSFTEMDISQGSNVVFKRKFIRQLQFDDHLKSDEIYRLLRSISLTNIYHRYFKYILWKVEEFYHDIYKLLQVIQNRRHKRIPFLCQHPYIVRLLHESSLDLNFPPFSEHLCIRGFVELYLMLKFEIALYLVLTDLEWLNKNHWGLWFRDLKLFIFSVSWTGLDELYNQFSSQF